jgi:thymidylate synthase ThyX
MACEVKVIADSFNSEGGRITTMQLRYWRAIHAEFMTHRVFSRSASSSRAIPVAKMIEQVRNDPAGPIRFMKNKPGMQATEYLSEAEEVSARAVWSDAAHAAADWGMRLLQLNIHKQFANRLLEPFQYISVVVTATEWDNFFALRDHPDAMPEIQELARAMKHAMGNSTPIFLESGEWHLPYILPDERTAHPVETLVQLSTARCARVSYLTHEGNLPALEDDLGLFKRLAEAQPPHMSPLEHQAVAAPRFPTGEPLMTNLKRGWFQYRRMYEVMSEGTLNFQWFQDRWTRSPVSDQMEQPIKDLRS